MTPDLNHIYGCFRAEGSFLSGQSFGPGHIHDTYWIATAEKHCDDYILQRLNTRVFKDIPRLQENMERVTAHLRNKLSDITGSDLKRECLTLMRERNTDRSWYIDEQGNFWRMFIFISDHRSYERVRFAS